MKRLLLLLLFATSCFAQSTTVNSTGVQDPDGTVWANGTYVATFTPDAYHSVGQYTWTGGAIPTVIKGNLDGSGTFSVSIPSNTSISPAGSTWFIQACPNASSSCYGTKFPVIGATMNITSALNQVLLSPRFASTPQTWGYTDLELLTPPGPGATYYNVVDGKLHCWSGASWASCTPTSLPTANIGQIIANTTGGTNYAAQGQLFYSQSGDTIASIEAACSSLCTYIVTTPQTITLGANHTLSSNIQLDFLSGGKWTVNGAFTLTVNGNITGTLNQHFAGTSTIAFGPLQQYAPVEWFGAVGDGVTNDFTSIQNTLNAISLGQAVLQSKTYFIGTNTLSINKSNDGILGNNASAINGTFYSTPGRSDILSSSNSADIIDCFGTTALNTLYGNKFQNFSMSRSVIPNGIVNGPPVSGPVGLNIKYGYGQIVDRVVSEDSGAGLLLHGVGSGGVGYINNSIATWGLNGVTETTGNYVGFYIDSQNGDASPSLRMTGNNVASNLGAGVNTIGYLIYGTALNDFMGWNLETAGVSYGDFVQETGVTGIGGQDIHFRNSINDSCFASCIYISSVVNSSTSTIDIDGGWDELQGASSAAIHIIGSNNVVVRGVQVNGNSGMTYGILADTTSSNLAFVNNNILTPTGGISIVGGSDYTLKDNLIHSSGTGHLVDMSSSPAHVAMGGNVYSGTGTGVNIASGTTDVKGLETDVFDTTLTTSISSAVPFLVPPLGTEVVTFSATPTFSNIYKASIITLTANITSFTLAAGVDTEYKTLIFCENGTGGFTVASPANVRGLTVGTTASKCTTALLNYSANQSAWMVQGEVQNQ